MKSSTDMPSQKSQGEITAERVKHDAREALSLLFTPVIALAGILVAAFRQKHRETKVAESRGGVDSR
jgi:hypothetical protein